MICDSLRAGSSGITGAGVGDETLDVTTYDDAAAFTAEGAADPSAVGFLNGK